MKTKYDNIFWGILLILAAGLILAQQQGLIETFSTQFWMLAFAALALVFFIRYLLAGLRFWGWLFPVCGFLALAGMLWLGTSRNPDVWIAAPFFGAIAIPFLAAFAVDFRKNWWALIPALGCILLGAVIVFSDQLHGEVIGSMFSFAIAISFALVYLVNRKHWWALIPALVMAFSGTMSLLSSVTSRWGGALVTLIIAAVFFFVYFKYPKNWWALLPAGILGSIGINALLTEPVLGKFAQSSFPGAVLFLGWAATFGWLWRQRGQYPTAWARIPAMIASIVAIVLLAVGSLTEFGLVAILIFGGLALIYFGLRPKQETQPDKEAG